MVTPYQKCKISHVRICAHCKTSYRNEFVERWRSEISFSEIRFYSSISDEFSHQKGSLILTIWLIPFSYVGIKCVLLLKNSSWSNIFPYILLIISITFSVVHQQTPLYYIAWKMPLVVRVFIAISIIYCSNHLNK